MERATITEEVYRNYLELANSGLQPAIIGKYIGVSRATVCRFEQITAACKNKDYTTLGAAYATNCKLTEIVCGVNGVPMNKVAKVESTTEKKNVAVDEQISVFNTVESQAVLNAVVSNQRKIIELLESICAVLVKHES